MDVNLIKNELKKFIIKYKTNFDNMGQRQSQLLELGALVIAAEHYKRKGYVITPKNLIGGIFKVKTGAPGYPWNFSWFEASKADITIEIHSNISVYSYYTEDKGIYVVDVGVIKAGTLPDKQSRKKWVALDNKNLITFIEAKRIVIYPMLLAQFIGIIHEIKPNFLGVRRPHGFLKQEHFDPALVSIGYLHGTSSNIQKGFEKRGFKITIVPAFDIEIAKLRGRPTYESPLGRSSST